MTEAVDVDVNGERNTLTKDNLLDFMDIYLSVIETHTIVFNGSEYDLEAICERGGTVRT